MISNNQIAARLNKIAPLPIGHEKWAFSDEIRNFRPASFECKFKVYSDEKDATQELESMCKTLQAANILHDGQNFKVTYCAKDYNDRARNQLMVDEFPMSDAEEYEYGITPRPSYTIRILPEELDLEKLEQAYRKTFRQSGNAQLIS